MVKPETDMLIYAGVLFGCLVCSGLYINKYVLSVLGFKYPTIFQGWQTLAGMANFVWRN